MEWMRENVLGDSGLSVSRIGLGCNNFGRVTDLAGTRAIVDAALDAGMTFLDTAESYGGGDSERFIGEALLGRRERVVLATKFGGGPPGGHAPAAPRPTSAARSRRRWRGCRPITSTCSTTTRPTASHRSPRPSSPWS